MRALITGATGFVGSYLTRRLVRAGHQVAVLLRPHSPPGRLTDVIDAVQRIDGDLTRLEKAAPAIREFAPETVFHLGWQGVTNDFRNDPSQYENIKSSLELLDLAQQCDCRAWVGLGSQAEYGPHSATLDESTPTCPTTLYGAAKLATVQQAQQAARQGTVRVIWLRLFSSYGPQDNPTWLIPQLIDRVLERQPMQLTPGQQLWDYIYVEDAAEAIYQAGATDGVEGIFNLGSGQAHTIRSIVERIRDAIDPTWPLVFGEIPYRPDQVMHLQADIRKLTAATGWRPIVSLDEGLKRTIQWHCLQSTESVGR